MNHRRTTSGPMEVQQESSCAMCGGAKVTTTLVQHTFTYGSGQSAAKLTVRVPVRQCEACEFEYLDEVGERLRHEAVCQHLGVLPPAKIRQIRESHKMTRANFSEVTGLGEASLNRWENGINIQTHANDRYLRLLASPHIMRDLERLVARGASPRPDSGPTDNPFRVLELTDAMRKKQQGFRLRRAA